jgi:pimeloyl-ACP methyl ester carboxylesterase
MRRTLAFAVLAFVLSAATCCAQTPSPRVVDVPTRPGVTERVLYLTPSAPKAAAVLFAGGNGYVGIGSDGTLVNAGNFLVRTRALFVNRGFAVAVVDPPSDRMRPPYLGGFRQSPEHVADIAAIIAWLRKESRVPVWLIGTSRGTQSVAYAATQLPTAAAGGPDGIVLTSTILVGSNAQDRAVPQMALGRIDVPVLLVHHVHDACPLCPFPQLTRVTSSLRTVQRSQIMAMDGGTSTGDPCEAFAYHGFNGIEGLVVGIIADWIV